jgi:uncharacterized RDD family membrane protein YckC
MELIAVTLWRRLAAAFYDGLVLICIVFIAWQPVPLLPDDQWPEWLSRGVRLGYLLAVIILFFGWFWTHGGQTIGMRAWKIRLVDDSPGATSTGTISSLQVVIRLAVAAISWAVLGMGFLWSLLDRERRTWHDMASRSRLVKIN